MAGPRRNGRNRVGLERRDEQRGKEKAAFIRRDQTTRALRRVQMRSAVGNNGVRRDF